MGEPASAGAAFAAAPGAGSRSRVSVADVAAAEAEAAALDAVASQCALLGPTRVEGWMAKEGHVFRTWKNRWFVLQGRAICYYTKEGAKKPQGVITLAAGTDVMVEEGYAKPFCFSVLTPGKKFILQAANEEEMAEWIEAIQHNIEACPPSAAGEGAAGEDDD